jgi:hypothetical protein
MAELTRAQLETAIAELNECLYNISPSGVLTTVLEQTRSDFEAMLAKLPPSMPEWKSPKHEFHHSPHQRDAIRAMALEAYRADLYDYAAAMRIEPLQGCYVTQSKPKNAQTAYKRLQARTGHLCPNGKRVQHLRKDELPTIDERLAIGDQLSWVDAQLKPLQERAAKRQRLAA